MTLRQTRFAAQLMIAMPDMSDPRFAGTVIYICAHSDDGAMGLIINKPLQNVRFANLLDQMDIACTGQVPDVQVHFGGPVEQQCGFVLHSGDYKANDSTLQVDDTYRMTATLDVLEDIAKGMGPDMSIMALGYAGWGPGQLEYEISQNGWLTCPPDQSIVFGADNDSKWSAALRLMGIDPLLLSATAGRA